MHNVGTRTFEVNYQESIWDLYHGYQAVSIAQIDELPGQDLGMRVVFASNVPNFSHFMVAVDDEAMNRSDSGIVTIRFDTNGVAPKRITVKAVYSDGGESETHNVAWSFSPRTTGEDGFTRENNMVRMTTNPLIQPATAPMEDWQYPTATDEEVAFAHDKWAHVLEGIEGDYARGRALAKPIMADLFPHKGSPSDRVRGATPFEQYEMMVSGQEKGFCTSFGGIFECACKAFGILVRRIGMCDSQCVSHRLFVRQTSNHCVTELFDRETNQWILMDLTYYMLGAYLGDEGPLTNAEFHWFLNQPHRRKRLYLEIYDIASDTERVVPFAECPKKELDSYSYDGWGTRFSYKRV